MSLTSQAISAKASTPETRPSVLLVDDEPNILDALQRTLRKENFDLITATSGEQALSKIFSKKIDLVVSDQRMPGMSGSELLAKIKERFPESVRIILTGYQDISAAVAAINEGGAYQFLQKPWDDEALKLTIRQALHNYQLAQENKTLRVRVEIQNKELRELNLLLEKRVEERSNFAEQKVKEAKNLAEDLRTNFSSSVEVIRRLIALRQPEEEDLHQYIRKIVDFMIPRLQISPPDSVWISIAAALHGIGRLALPDSILQKSFKTLEPAEKRHFETHVIHGAEIMKCIPQLAPLAPFLRSHQERWDGKGYPDRLAGDQIPLGAQIIGIANDYVRSRSWLTQHDARELIFRNSGIAYQPKLVQLILEYIQQEESTLPEFKIVKLRPDQLKEGMVLAEDLKTSAGVLIAASESTLTLMQVAKIKGYHDAHPFREPLSVYTRYEKSRKKGA